ncbi:MAG: GNAT family N-acetyltransferase [Caldilineaceae bacterium]
MANQCTIRAFTEADTEQTIQLWNQYLPHDPITIEKLAQFCDLSQFNPAGVFVAEYDGKLIGFLPTIISNDKQYRNKGWILSLVVHMDYQQTGVGQAIVTSAVSFLKSQGKHELEVANCKEFSFSHILTADVAPVFSC